MELERFLSCVLEKKASKKPEKMLLPDKAMINGPFFAGFIGFLLDNQAANGKPVWQRRIMLSRQKCAFFKDLP